MLSSFRHVGCRLRRDGPVQESSQHRERSYCAPANRTAGVLRFVTATAFSANSTALDPSRIAESSLVARIRAKEFKALTSPPSVALRYHFRDSAYPGERWRLSGGFRAFIVRLSRRCAEDGGGSNPPSGT